MDALVEELSALLKEKSLILASAESCTGGMIAASMTERAGSSSVFDRGFITYSNASKIEILGVDEAILQDSGAVSSACALAMAMGALKNSAADITVSVTGIAGPDGGTAEKPVGLVYIGIGTLAHSSFVKEHHFTGERHAIRTQAVQTALILLIEAVRAI